MDILDNKIENRTKEEIGEAIKTLKQEANDDWAGILKARDGTRVEQRPQAVDKNKQTLQDQIDANQKRINELNDLIDNHDATIQATIDGEQAKGRNITQKSIDEYKKRQESIKITRIRERDLLVVQNQKLQGSLQDPDLLRRDESHIQKYIAQVEVSKNSDQSSDDWVSQSNEGQEVIALRKTPKNNKQALKWMRNQKGGFTLEDSSLTNLTEAEKKEHLKQERKNLDNIYNATKKLDLPTVVSWLHAQPLLTSKQEWQNKIKTACPKERKHKGKIVDFAGFYFDFRQR